MQQKRYFYQAKYFHEVECTTTLPPFLPPLSSLEEEIRYFRRDGFVDDPLLFSYEDPFQQCF